MAERLFMRHPETGGVSQTTRKAFTNAWSSKGWKEVEAKDLKDEDVRRVLAEEYGVSVSEEAKPKEIKEALAGALGNDLPDEGGA